MMTLTQHQSSTLLAPERCKSFTFDVNQQADSLVRWEQRYNQHSQGMFHGYLDELKLGGIHFFEEFTNQTLQQQCNLKDNNLWLGFSLERQAKINNTEVNVGQIMTRPSKTEFELITPGNFRIYGLVLDKEKLQHQMVNEDIDKVFHFAEHQAFAQTNAFISYEIAKLINLLLGKNSLSTEPNLALHLDQPHRLNLLMPLINSKVADLLVQLHLDATQQSVSQQTQQMVITQINHYIKQHEHYPLTVTELCQITNVSRRTLQYCFKAGLGITPIQYIRDCRLNEIRRKLLSLDNDNAITDLAIAFGFFHISTFNAHYKQLFGETPTQTKQRAVHYQRG